MILAATKRHDLTGHYDCYVEKEKSKCNPPIWWLRGKEVVMQGGDAFDEVHDLAAGDCSEELLMWAQLQGLDIAKMPEL